MVDFEKAGSKADLERLTPIADSYFSEACGASYTSAMADGSPDGSVAAARQLTTSPQLENGDALPTEGANPGGIALSSTETKSYYFTAPANTTTFSLIDQADAVIATWIDTEFPEL